MAQATWEKSTLAAEELRRSSATHNRLKFLIGGLLILLAVGYLIVSGTLIGGRYFITVDDLLADPSYVDQNVRISGAVLGPSIEYDADSLTIEFTIAHIPTDFGNLALALNEAVNDPSRTRLPIIIHDEVMPDLLQHEAQAIIEGRLGEDGVFYATTLLLKCPSRFEEAGTNQAIAGEAEA